MYPDSEIKKMKILVAEDNADSRKLILKQFRLAVMK
jgi:hypothetical protein